MRGAPTRMLGGGAIEPRLSALGFVTLPTHYLTLINQGISYLQRSRSSQVLLQNKFLTYKLSNSLRRQEEEKIKQHFRYEEEEKTASIRVMGISGRQKIKRRKYLKL